MRRQARDEPPRMVANPVFFGHIRHVSRPLSRLLFSLLVSTAVLAPAAAAGILRWEATEVSIEAPPLAEVVEGTFTFTNTTAEPVTIADVHSSCGCTVPELAKRTFAPGESGKLRAVFTLGDRVGPQEKSIQVTTAAPAQSHTVLTLRVEIPKLFEVSPYFVIWNCGDPATPRSIDVRLLRPDIVTLGDVESKHAAFIAQATPAEDSADHLVVTITPASTDAPLNGAILVNLRTPGGKTRTVTLYALVRGTPTAPGQPPAATGKP